MPTGGINIVEVFQGPHIIAFGMKCFYFGSAMISALLHYAAPKMAATYTPGHRAIGRVAPIRADSMSIKCERATSCHALKPLPVRSQLADYRNFIGSLGR